MEIFADLKSSGIYLSGESVKCQVTFYNSHSFDPESMQERLEHLAWSSVQIQCVCQVATALEPSRRESESGLDSLNAGSTSLQPQKDAFSREVFATKPKILFCDLFLEPQESKTFQFEDVIPISAPHSYNGRGLKYAYRLIVASQRLNQSIASLRIPFRVMSVSSLNLNEMEQQRHGINERQVNPSITNPFLMSNVKESGEKATSSILSLLQEPSARRVATFYNVTNSKVSF